MRDKLAVQMYTIRDFTKTRSDLKASLKRVAEMGYPAVQLSAVGAMAGEIPEVSVADARKMLDDNGLKCIATHRGWDDLLNKTDAEIEFHKTLGCDYVAIGSIPGGFNQLGADGYRKWIAEAQPVIQRLKEAGIRFGYHNHAFEFQRSGDGNKTLFDLFIEEGGPDLTIEMDVYWVDHAGANPVRYIERLHGRLPVIHIKDKEMAGNEPVMAPIGEGNLDWPDLLGALEAAGTEWIAIEQDVCRRDPFDCLRSSYEFLTNFKS